MATAVDTNAPDAEVAEATLVEGAFYSSIDSCEQHLLALNSEGAVDYGKNGKFYVQYKPSPKTKYTMVAAGTQASYLLRDDGIIVRTVGSGENCEISPPEKVKYTQVSSGYSASYFLRDDGKVDRTKGSGKIELTTQLYFPNQLSNYSDYFFDKKLQMQNTSQGFIFDFIVG